MDIPFFGLGIFVVRLATGGAEGPGDGDSPCGDLDLEVRTPETSASLYRL